MVRHERWMHFQYSATHCGWVQISESHHSISALSKNIIWLPWMQWSIHVIIALILIRSYMTYHIIMTLSTTTLYDMRYLFKMKSYKLACHKIVLCLLGWYYSGLTSHQHKDHMDKVTLVFKSHPKEQRREGSNVQPWIASPDTSRIDSYH